MQIKTDTGNFQTMPAGTVIQYHRQAMLTTARSKIWATRLGYEKQTDLFASNDAHGVYMLVYEEETGKIIKACMNVFNELGNVFLEAVYQEALALEFGLMKIPYKKEAKIEIFYKGNKLNKEYYADFICYDKIIVELKCVSKLVNANKAQVINYLHGTHFAVGLLVNFGESSLKWERLTLLKNKEK